MSHNSLHKISVIVCAYNEEQSVGQVLDQLGHLTFIDEIICVNNGSTDKTGSIFREMSLNDQRLQILEIKVNRGLGYGFKLGVAATTGTIVVRQDADLEYSTAELYSLIEPLLTNSADVVMGSRRLGNKNRYSPYLLNQCANTLFTSIVNLLFKTRLTDVETGAKAFRGELIRQLPLSVHGFDIEIEILSELLKRRCKIIEVPISYHGRTTEEGKKIVFFDAIITLYRIIKLFLKMRRSPL